MYYKVFHNPYVMNLAVHMCIRITLDFFKTFFNENFELYSIYYIVIYQASLVVL